MVWSCLDPIATSGTPAGSIVLSFVLQLAAKDVSQSPRMSYLSELEDDTPTMFYREVYLSLPCRVFSLHWANDGPFVSYWNQSFGKLAWSQLHVYMAITSMNKVTCIISTSFRRRMRVPILAHAQAAFWRHSPIIQQGLDYLLIKGKCMSCMRTKGLPAIIAFLLNPYLWRKTSMG